MKVNTIMCSVGDGHVDISASPPSYHAGTLCPELEGSVSMLTCKFEETLDASTDAPKVSLESLFLW